MNVHRSALFAALVATACAPRGAPAPAAPAPQAAPPLAPLSICDLSGESIVHADTLTVAAPGAVDPSHAPIPVTGAERVLFRQLYETLVRVDCEGHLHPALAASWSSSDGGRTWTVILADGAIFWDGVPVSARDVLAAWGPAISGVADSAVATGERTLLVRLRRPSPDGPAALADAGLAIAKRVPGIAWPIGTGRYWVQGTGPELIVVPLGGTRLPVIRWRTTAGDPRDLLDAGVDLLVTDDAGALAYAATRADFASVPLPWDRTYVLLAAAPFPATDLPLNDLARHAVRVEARPATLPFWWQNSSCAVGAPPASASLPPGNAIVFAQGDAVARDLADRLVALAPDGPARRAVGLLPDAFAARLGARGGDWFIVALPRTALDPCAAGRDFAARVPWLTPAGIVPLVDVRRRALVRRAGARLSVDWDAVPRIQ